MATSRPDGHVGLDGRPIADAGGGFRRVLTEPAQVGGFEREDRRTREVEHVIDDAIQAHDLFVDVANRFANLVGGRLGPKAAQCGLDDHQRIPHFVGDDRRQPAQ